MKLVIAYIAPFKLDEVRDALKDAGVSGLSVSNIHGFGRQAGHTETYRGSEYKVDLLPKVKIELVIAPERVEPILEVICAAARTGRIGDGKIFVSPIETAVRIRNGERGDAVL